MDNLRKGLEEYASVYVFTFENMRSTQFKSVRARWSGSRFYLGKNKVMQIALGRSGQDEAAHDLHKLSRVCPPMSLHVHLPVVLCCVALHAMWLRNSRTLVSPLSSSAVVQQLVGNSGLFLTNSPADEVATYVSCAALPSSR